MKDLKKGIIFKEINLSTGTEEEILEATEILLNDLTEYHKSFLKDVETHNTIENENHKSPITIFNGKWGSGKTYFINKFIKYFETIKTQEDAYFKDLNYINGLDLVDDENVLYSFLLELYNQNSSSKKKLIEHLKDGLKTGINIYKLIKNLGDPSSINFNNQENKLENYKENSIVHNRTIVFVDNLERMGDDSIKILRLLYKLRIVENLYFVLITNINALEENIGKNHSGGEVSLLKFLETPSFEFKQSYNSLIKNLNVNGSSFNYTESKLLNQFMNNYDDNEILSIRELKNWLLNSDYLKKEPIDKLKMIRDIIPKNFNTILNLLYEEPIKRYVASIKGLLWNLTKIKNQMKDNIIDKRLKSGSYSIKNGLVYLKYNGYMYKCDSPNVYEFYLEKETNNYWLQKNNNGDVSFEEHQNQIMKLEDVKQKCKGKCTNEDYLNISSTGSIVNFDYFEKVFEYIDNLSENKTINDIIENLNEILDLEIEFKSLLSKDSPLQTEGINSLEKISLNSIIEDTKKFIEDLKPSDWELFKLSFDDALNQNAIKRNSDDFEKQLLKKVDLLIKNK